MYLTMPFVDGATIELPTLLELLGTSWLLMVTFGTIPFAAGMIAGKRAVAMAVGVLVVIGSFILSTFGQAVDWLSDYERFSLLYYFPANEIVQEEGEWWNLLVLLAITMVGLLTAIIVFRRRDIK